MKGVEGLVAAALLLVITVAGGLLLYNYVMNYLSLPQQYVSLKVVSAKIVVLDSTSSMLTIQVSNLGNIPANITGVTVYTGGSTYSVSLSNHVPAGSTITINVGLNSTVTSAVVASSQVYISVNYTSNGSSGATDLVKVPVYY